MNDYKFCTARAAETAAEATPAGVGRGRLPGQAGVVGPAVGRVSELAGQVVDSATNPLLMLPDELARAPREPRGRGKSPRHRRSGE
jgi:hypothetical protein